MKFSDTFENFEGIKGEDGWTHFKATIDQDEAIEVPGEQLAFNDAHTAPVQTGLGILGMGFKKQGGHITGTISGRFKIEYRP